MTGSELHTIRVDDEIVIRPLIASDAEPVFALVDANRAYLARWLPWVDGISTIDDERQWIERMADPDSHDRERPYAIEHRGVVVGGIGIIVEPINRSGEIGYWLAEAMQGSGIVTRACRALLDDAFRSQGLHRLFIRTDPENRRSRAVPESLGFVCEGTQRESLYANGEYRDAIVYSVLASEWPARKQ